MKRILWTAAVFFVVNVMVHAQVQTSAEIKQSAQQLLSQTQTTHTQFATTQADLNARNKSNIDAAAYLRLRTEIARLESWINREQTSIGGSLDSGNLVSAELLDRVQRFIDQHTTAMSELQSFISQ